jgi:hypothetical protein
MAATRTQVATYLNDEQLEEWRIVKEHCGKGDAEVMRLLISKAAKEIMSGTFDAVDDRVRAELDHHMELIRLIAEKVGVTIK